MKFEGIKFNILLKKSDIVIFHPLRAKFRAILGQFFPMVVHNLRNEWFVERQTNFIS